MPTKPSTEVVGSVVEFIGRVKSDYEAWDTKSYPWFRGEKEFPGGELTNRLLPKLYWPKSDVERHNENQLLQRFRQKAPTLAAGMEVPPRSGHTDQWLFLARHMELPTRLLDWTEGALTALYFALQNRSPGTGRPTVWMLEPLRLNRNAIARARRVVGPALVDSEPADNEFHLTWFQPKGYKINIGYENIRGAWEKGKRGLELPVAIHPTNIHPRMAAQKSCFTVHGKKELSLSALVDQNCLMGYVIDPNARQTMLDDLRMMGISQSSLFPELEGLAKELAELF